jgi:hypothetical protein
MIAMLIQNPNFYLTLKKWAAILVTYIKEPIMRMGIFVSSLILSVLPVFVSAQLLTFDKDDVGKAPAGFSTALTGGGEPGVWVVMKDASAPSKPNVLAQTDQNTTSYRFLVCVYDAITAKDIDVSVKFKPIKGKEDQAAGIVWRYKDKDNYYIVRANANEGNVVAYKVEKGQRTDLPLIGKGKTYGTKDPVPSGVWGTLRIAAKGTHINVYHNDKKLFEVEDGTFTEAGRVGLWTKADSYTLFDDLSITVLK